jgi:hypothetical protein
MQDRNIQDWLSHLTHHGYDIQGVNGYTNRGDWNVNHPMPSIAFHLNNGKTDIVLKAYATNSYRWTIYGTMFTGKAPNRNFGFDVTGKKETGIGDYDELFTLIK